MSDARVRIAWVAAAGILALCLDQPLSLGLLALLGALPVLAERRGREALPALLLASAGIAWGTVTTQALFYGDVPRTSWAALGPVHIWREGVLHGLVQSLRVIAVLWAGASLVLGTTPERLLAGLRGVGVPPGLAFLTALSLRMVPVLTAEVLVVRQARARRGRPVWARWPWQWLALEVSALVPVLARALRRGRRLAEALDARGFDLASPPVEPEQRLGVADRALLGALGTITGSVVALRILYVLYVTDTWWWPALRPLYALVRLHL